MEETVFLLSLLSNSCVVGSPYSNMSDVQKSELCIIPSIIQMCHVARKPVFWGFVQDTQTGLGKRTGLVVRATDSGSGDPGSILGRVGVLFA